MNYIIDLLTSYLLLFFNLHTKILDTAVFHNIPVQ